MCRCVPALTLFSAKRYRSTKSETPSAGDWALRLLGSQDAGACDPARLIWGSLCCWRIVRCFLQRLFLWYRDFRFVSWILPLKKWWYNSLGRSFHIQRVELGVGVFMGKETLYKCIKLAIGSHNVRGCVSFNSSGDMWLKRLLARFFAASKFGLRIHTHQIFDWNFGASRCISFYPRSTKFWSVALSFSGLGNGICYIVVGQSRKSYYQERGSPISSTRIDCKIGAP